MFTQTPCGASEQASRHKPYPFQHLGAGGARATRWGKAQEGYTLANHLGYSVNLPGENRRFVRPVPAPHTLVQPSRRGGNNSVFASTALPDAEGRKTRGPVCQPASPHKILVPGGLPAED
jgi:hypothetical protein